MGGVPMDMQEEAMNTRDNHGRMRYILRDILRD
jgi:hypothetical protein